jgi:antitoxin ParD1/3/4
MASTERLVVELPSDLVAALRHAVQSGPFASESEVLTTVLRASQGDNSLTEAELEEVRAAVAEGLADAEAGRFVDADEMFKELHARYSGSGADRSRD